MSEMPDRLFVRRLSSTSVEGALEVKRVLKQYIPFPPDQVWGSGLVPDWPADCERGPYFCICGKSGDGPCKGSRQIRAICLERISQNEKEIVRHLVRVHVFSVQGKERRQGVMLITVEHTLPGLSLSSIRIEFRGGEILFFKIVEELRGSRK